MQEMAQGEVGDLPAPETRSVETEARDAKPTEQNSKE